MAVSSGWSNPDDVEFARMVARLRVDPGFAREPGQTKSEPDRYRVSNGTYSAVWMGGILPMSIVVGGWLGLVVLGMALAVVAIIYLDEDAPSARRAVPGRGVNHPPGVDWP